MVKSMTGFGRGEVTGDGHQAVVEIRSVNGRFCDVSIRLPRNLSELEPRITERIQARIVRGRVSVTVNWNDLDGEHRNLSLRTDLARVYRDSLLDLQRQLNVPGEIDIQLIAGMPDVIAYEIGKVDAEFAWAILVGACDAALDQLEQMRRSEGALLSRYLIERIGVLEQQIEDIEARTPRCVEQARDRLQERLQKLLQVEYVDEQRLAMEVALIAERSDVTEECERFRSHTAQCLEALNTGESVGRRLNFLLQEMHREANTLGSKANDAGISHIVIRVKEEIEKLREQIQNIE